jgi:hypothetical protein
MVMFSLDSIVNLANGWVKIVWGYYKYQLHLYSAFESFLWEARIALTMFSVECFSLKGV